MSGRTLLSFGGAILGFALAGAFGAQIGFLAGSLLGAVLFPPDDIRNEGSRLKDLQVTSSTYGRPIPIIMGGARVGSNVVWSTGLIEHVHEEEVGGKGGPSVTNVSYSYTASWRSVFAKGVAVGLPRIWMNTKLQFDQTGTSQLAENGVRVELGSFAGIVATSGLFKSVGSGTNGVIRIYPGGATQEPDPDEEAHIGVGLVPAYRGVTSVTFVDYQLADFGNALPQTEAEVITDATSTLPEQLISPEFAINAGTIHMHSLDQRYAIIWNNDGQTLSCYSFEARQYLWSFDPPTGDLGYADTSLDTVFVGNGSTLWALDIVTGEVKGQYPGFINNDGFDEAKIIYTRKGSGLTANEYVISLAHFGHLNICHMGSPATPGFVPNVRYSVNIRSLLLPSTNDTNDQTLTRDSNGDIWFCLNIIGGTPSYLLRVEPELLPGTEGINVEIVANPLDTLTVPGGVTIMSYLPETNSFIMAADGNNTFNEWSLDTRDFTGNSFSYGSIEEGNLTYFLLRNGSIGGQIWLHTGDQALYDFVDYTGVVRTVEPADWPNPGPGQASGIYDPINHAILVTETGSGSDTLIFLDRITQGSTTLKLIVEKACTEAGYTLAQLDTTALTDIVKGWVFVGRGQAKTQIALLEQIYNFHTVEEDWKLKFVKNGGTSVATITEDDIGVESGFIGADNKIEIERADLRELPVSFEINYMDQPFDYQAGTQKWQRIQEATVARRKPSISVPWVSDPDEVLQTAERIGETTHAQKNAYTFSVGPKFYRLSPADPITIDIDEFTVEAKVLSAEQGANGVYAIRAIQENAESHNLTGNTGTGSSGFGGQTIGAAGLTVNYLMDLPIVLDVQDGVGITYALGSINATDWPGASQFFSSDLGDNWSVEKAVLSANAVKHGKSTVALPSASHTIWDRTNTLTVRMFDGAPASATEVAVLSGANFGVLGQEYIQWADVVDNMDGTYDLTNLLRGRKGTEWAVGTHAIDERFLIFATNTIHNHVTSLSLLNEVLYYRAVPFNSAFNLGTQRQITWVGNSRKPYAVAQIRGAWDTPSTDDIRITWKRRTRLDGWWADGTSSVPLGEESEEYELEILDGLGAVVRTVTGLTSATYDYTSAQQTTDFLGAQTSINVNIYQISASVGRGFVSNATLTEVI